MARRTRLLSSTLVAAALLAALPETARAQEAPAPAPRVFTNEDLPRHPRISVLGTLTIDGPWDTLPLPAPADDVDPARSGEGRAPRSAPPPAVREARPWWPAGLVYGPFATGHWSDAVCLYGRCPDGTSPFDRRRPAAPPREPGPVPPGNQGDPSMPAGMGHPRSVLETLPPASSLPGRSSGRGERRGRR